MISRENLNKRICDCEECENNQTYYEFIREAENEFQINQANLYEMNDEELLDYLNYLNDFWF